MIRSAVLTVFAAALLSGASPVVSPGAASRGEGRLPHLLADPGPPRHAYVGQLIELDGSHSTGAVRYQWSIGDGSPPPAASPSPRVWVRYTAPGRYHAVLSVFDRRHRRRSRSVSVTVTPRPRFRGSSSSTVAVVLGRDLVAAVSPDSDELTLIERRGGRFQVARRVPTPRHPRTVTVWGETLAVPCQDDDVVLLVPIDGSAPRKVALPWGSRPYGAAVVGGDLFVSLQGSGRLAQLDRRGHLSYLDAVVDARGVAALPDGRVAVTRWRSADSGGEVVVIDPDSGARQTVHLAVDHQRASDTEIGGVPSYLGQLVVSPTGRSAAIPSLQANILDGLAPRRSGRKLRFDTMLRAVVTFVDLGGGRGAAAPGQPDSVHESSSGRVQLDNRGFAAAAAYSSRGDYLYIALPGNRAITRYDVLAGTQSGSLAQVGFAPDGVAVSADDRYLFVNAFMSRELVVYDMKSFVDSSPPVARLPLASSEPLSPRVLAGKRLFYDSADPRLSRDGYIACAHCHLDGESDNRVWDFTQRGEGLRNTISLLGRGDVHRPIHWSGNFDEIQDFEHDLREAFGGRGLASGDRYHASTRDRPLGASKAGISPELDALAAYVHTLTEAPRSPASAPDGGLSMAARRGKALFESPETGCTTCHSGPHRTDARWLEPGVPLLHDVGTLTAASGQRMGSFLPGLVTPPLEGLSSSWPYLHDGSAATLEDVLGARNPDGRHGDLRNLTMAQRDDLVEFLRSL